MLTCRVTAILWNAFGMRLIGLVLCGYSMKRFDSCFYIGFLYLHICKRICNVLICFLRRESRRHHMTWSHGPDDVRFGKVPISNFCRVLSNFYAENWFFILFQSAEVIALQKFFLKFLHCKRWFDNSKQFVLLWIPVFWFQ